MRDLRLLAGLAVLLVGCGGASADSTAPPAPRLVSMTLVAAQSSIVAGSSTQVTASGRDHNGQPIGLGTLSWVSSNSAVATVDQAGTVSGVSAGMATITASSGTVVATVSMTVTAAPVLTTLSITTPTSVLVSGATATFSVAGRDQFGATIAVPTVTWSSSAPTVLDVDANGIGVARLAGIATVRAASGSVAGAVTVSVSPGAATQLVISRPAAGAFNAFPFSTQPTVEVRDAAGNRIGTDNSTQVTMSAGTGASLLGTSVRTALGGVVSFSGVGLRGTHGSSYTVTFSAVGLTPATQAVRIDPFSFGNGTRLVNSQIPPGRYRSVNGSTASCYWARLRDASGATSSIHANDIGPGPRLVEILSSDFAFESSSCATWTQITGPVTASPTNPFANGVFLVGVDVQPGTWQSDGVGASCYWARLRNLTGAGDIIANYFGSAPALVTILPTDVAFEASQCGTWRRLQ